MFVLRLELPGLRDGVHLTGLLILSLSLISLQSLKVRSTKECKDLTAKYSLESKKQADCIHCFHVLLHYMAIILSVVFSLSLSVAHFAPSM